MDTARNELGVAMVTVLFVGAALTVVSSTAAFVTIKEFQSGADDRRATEALAFAESGVDRLMLELARGTFTWNEMNEAGCAYAPIGVPRGNLGNQKVYDAQLTVFHPELAAAQRLPDLQTWRKPGDTWEASWNDNKQLCTDTTRPGPEPGGPQVPQWFAITSTGKHPTATRQVRQVVKIGTRGLPIGMEADTVEITGGNPSAANVSLITPGDVTSDRNKMSFSGTDPYYTLHHFWESLSSAVAAPAAVHALGSVKCSANPSTTECTGGVEHSPSRKLNCGANGNNGQSQWDQSGGGSTITVLTPCAGQSAAPPPSSFFSLADYKRAAPTPELNDQDYANLKAAAKAYGIYCPLDSGGGGTCTKPTGTFTVNSNTVIQDLDVAGLRNNFVAYFDFPPTGDPLSRFVKWSAAVGPCNDSAPLSKSVVIVVRYGGIELAGNGEIVGAFLAEQGEIALRGSGAGFLIHGTLISKSLDLGGNARVQMSSCWVKNLPGGFLRVTPESFSEVDR